METKDEILTELTKILVDMFEVNADEITPDSRLYEELDLDSIDSVDMIVTLQRMIGKKAQPTDFKSARTVQDIVNVVHQLIHES